MPSVEITDERVGQQPCSAPPPAVSVFARPDGVALTYGDMARISGDTRKGTTRYVRVLEVRPPLQAEFIGQKGQAHPKNQLIERWNIRVDVASSGGP